ncbi:MAG: hypothetical protein ABFR33_06830, partial [Verrucomicrobiota bacterium]
TVPFEAEPKADFRDVEPAAVVENFDASVGQRFELLQSVVFSFFGKGFTGLGYLSIDPESDTYALSCMTPAGITLFELKGEGAEVEALFIPPQLEKHGDRIAEGMGRDLRRIYFGWSPPDGAEVKHKKNRLVFKAKQDGETVEHRYSGPRRLLTEKRFSKGWITRCIVRYYDYEEFDGRLYPKGIILYNKQFHYRMVLRLKTVYPVQDNG